MEGARSGERTSARHAVVRHPGIPSARIAANTTRRARACRPEVGSVRAAHTVMMRDVGAVAAAGAMAKRIPGERTAGVQAGLRVVVAHHATSEWATTLRAAPASLCAATIGADASATGARAPESE